MKKEPTAEFTIHGMRELKELQAAGRARIEDLEKAAKQSEDRDRPEEAAITRKRIKLWRGEDKDNFPGLLDRMDATISIFEPAFTSNGKEPSGQQDLLDGVRREERPTDPRPAPDAEPDAVPPPVLKAALILGYELPVNHLGRATTALLSTLDGIQQSILYQVVMGKLTKMTGAVDVDEQKALEELSAAIVADPDSLLPSDQPFPINAVGGGETGRLLDEAISTGDLEMLTEEEWSMMTRDQLERIVVRHEAESMVGLILDVGKLNIPEEAIKAEDFAGLKFDDLAAIQRHFILGETTRPKALEQLLNVWATRNLPPSKYEPTEQEKHQEEYLRTAAVNSEVFKLALRQGSIWSVSKALEIVQGIEGNKGREKALQKRLAELEGESPQQQEEAVPASAVADVTAGLI